MFDQSTSKTTRADLHEAREDTRGRTSATIRTFLMFRNSSKGRGGYQLRCVVNYTERPWKIAAYRCARVFLKKIASVCRISSSIVWYYEVHFRSVAIYTAIGNLLGSIAKHAVLKFTKHWRHCINFDWYSFWLILFRYWEKRKNYLFELFHFILFFFITKNITCKWNSETNLQLQGET